MFALSLFFIPLIGLLTISSRMHYHKGITGDENINYCCLSVKKLYLKTTALIISILTLFISLVMFILFDFSSIQYQFVQNPSDIGFFNLYLGIDGSSMYFVLLTTIIMPISLLSNWTSISGNLRPYLITILLLEALLLSVFLALDGFLFYIFFESILPPLFIFIGLFGSIDRVRASFYLFLYTLLGSLFLLLAILTMSTTMGFTDYGALFKTNFIYYAQLFLFSGVFIAFAVKTPVIFLNSWLLKAHVESPLSGSIILAGIVLKLSLYGVFRLILPILPKAYIISTCLVYTIGVITIVYASISTIRTIDVKELIAYSSVCHAAVYLMGVFSNTVPGIEGGIILALAHGFVSSGLFICVGGVLYDRSSTRLITSYRGIAQILPIFSVLFFILSLGNCAAPLTLNFIGEFMSLYGVFEKQAIFGLFASSSIIFSAAYTIYMFNRIAFAGSYCKHFTVNIPDLNKREFYMLLILVLFTVALGINPAPLLDGIHYSATTLIYSSYWYLCIIPIFKLIHVHKASNKANLLYLLLPSQRYSNVLYIHLIKLYNFLKWGLNSPPKPHAYVNHVNLSSQSYLLATLLLSSLSDLHLTINNLPDIYNVSDFFTFFIICACLVAPLIVYSEGSKGKMPSLGNDADKDEDSPFKPLLPPKPKDDDNDRPNVNIGYMVHEQTGARGTTVDVRLFDTEQKTAIRLKRLYPSSVHKFVDIPTTSGYGVQLKNARISNPSNTTTAFRQGFHTLPDGTVGWGVWVPRPPQSLIDSLGYNVTSQGRPVVFGNRNKYMFVHF